MQTNYKKLSLFDVCTVIVVVVGVFIIGLIIFNYLSLHQQEAFVKSLAILDIDKPFSQSVQNIKTAWNFQQDFYNRFYIAFTQVATISPDAFDGIKQMALGTEKFMNQSLNLNPTVAGAFIEKVYAQTNADSISNQICNPNLNTQSQTVSENQPVFDFQPPDLSRLKQNLFNFYKFNFN